MFFVALGDLAMLQKVRIIRFDGIGEKKYIYIFGVLL